MKVAYLSYFYPGIDPYGSSRYSQNLLWALSKMESIEVDFYCPYPIKKFCKIKNVNYIYIPFMSIPLIKFFSFGINLVKILKKRKIKYDIIHSNSGAGIFQKRIDFESYHHYEKFSIFDIFNSLSYSLARISLHRAKHIITESERSVKELHAKEMIKKETVSLIYNPIDFSVFKPLKYSEELKKKIVKNSNEKIILSVGSLLERKNFKLSIKTLKFLLDHNVDSRLVIIGNGNLKSDLENYGRKLSIENKITFLGRVEQIQRYYNIADLLLIPSKLEGFGYIYLEGPACGVKFIGFNTGIAPVAAKIKLGKIAKNDQEFMKFSLDFILKKNFIDDLAIGKLKHYFSLENYGQKLENLYKSYIFKRESQR